MAAVRKQAGKNVVAEKPAAAPAAPPPEKPAPLPPRATLSRAALLDALEIDRRAHDKLAQTAKQKRHDDEQAGAEAVIAYIQQLVGRLGEGGDL